MKHKKGTIIHWILLGVLFALGVFFFASKSNLLSIAPKGEWQLDFLRENYVAAQQELLKTSIVGRNVGSQVALDLARHGGYLPGEESPCGTIEGVQRWNRLDSFCFPPVDENFKQLARLRLAEALPGKQFSEMGISGSLFFARGITETIRTSHARYQYENSFAVNLPYSFEEYTQLELEASLLVEQCRDARNVTACILANKAPHWTQGKCNGMSLEEIPSRLVPFCVDSPAAAVLTLPGIATPLTYSLALDFTPLGPLVVEQLYSQATSQGSTSEIIFEPDEFAEGYVLYYTNWQEVRNRKGTVAEVFEGMPDIAEFGLFSKSVELANPKEINCPSEKETGRLYRCEDGKLHYLLYDNRLVAGNTYFTITTTAAGKESSIHHFAPLIVSGEKVG